MIRRLFFREGSDCHISTLVVDSVQGFAYKYVPAATPSRGTTDISKVAVVNRATGLTKLVYFGKLLYHEIDKKMSKSLRIGRNEGEDRVQVRGRGRAFDRNFTWRYEDRCRTP